MERCAELEELYTAICAALGQGDAAFFERRFSTDAGVLAIGSDPSEWWSGHAHITRVFGAQLAEMAGIGVTPGAAEAYRQGDVGWLAGRPVLELPDGTKVALRLTAVLQRSGDGWTIAQWHVSTGVANEQAVGEALTTE